MRRNQLSVLRQWSLTLSTPGQENDNSVTPVAAGHSDRSQLLVTIHLDCSHLYEVVIHLDCSHLYEVVIHLDCSHLTK